MKKVSAKLFFTVLWRGLCQAVGWFFGLFRYKKNGKPVKGTWGVFTTCVAIVMAIITISLVCEIGNKAYGWYYRRYHTCDDPFCYLDSYVSHNLDFHNHFDGKGYIYNRHTREKYLKNVEWIALPIGKDSLVCFSDGKKRGYFSQNTGKVIVEPKYRHAWIFSDGLASVEEDGYIKFIDGTGKVVIDNKMVYVPGKTEYVFHGGYCIIDTEDGELHGLMDKAGNVVLPLEYEIIEPREDYELWQVQKGKEMAVYDKEMKPVLPLSECELYVYDEIINVTMPDHTLRKYDMKGNLINDFYISSVRLLEYEKEEFLCRERSHDDFGNEYSVPFMEEYHPKATARLRAYVAGDGYEGLMTSDGHIVTMPLYHDIEAIDNDLYLCASTNFDKVIVNGKGEIVR